MKSSTVSRFVSSGAATLALAIGGCGGLGGVFTGKDASQGKMSVDGTCVEVKREAWSGRDYYNLNGVKYYLASAKVVAKPIVLEPVVTVQQYHMVQPSPSVQTVQTLQPTPTSSDGPIIREAPPAQTVPSTGPTSAPAKSM